MIVQYNVHIAHWSAMCELTVLEVIYARSVHKMCINYKGRIYWNCIFSYLNDIYCSVGFTAASALVVNARHAFAE
jgi:hypothetical protein